MLDTVFSGLSGAMTLDAFVVAVEDERPVGWAYTGNLHGTPVDHRQAYVVVGPGHEERGVGRALFSRVLAAVPPGSAQLRSRVFDDDERGLAVARHWGFEVTQRSIASTLRLEPGPGPEPPAGVVLEPADDLVFADQDAVEAMFAASQTNPEATTSHLMTLGRDPGVRLPGRASPRLPGPGRRRPGRADLRDRRPGRQGGERRLHRRRPPLPRPRTGKAGQARRAAPGAELGRRRAS